MEVLKDKRFQIGLAVFALMLILFVFMQTRKEGFESGSNALEVRMPDQEITIKPTLVRDDVRTLMSGSGFIPQKEIIPPWGEKYGLSHDLDDGEGGNFGFHHNLCSPACCSEQWPTPFKLPHDKFICNNKDEYVPNTYKCNNSWQNSGCLCMTKKQMGFLANRGGNA